MTLERKTFDDAMDWLIRFHGAEVSAIALDYFFKAFNNIDDWEFSKMVYRWCEMTTPTKYNFPSVNDLKKVLFELRDFEWQQKKSNEPVITELFSASGTTNNGREAIALMRDLHEGRKTRVEYLAAMYDMERKYPGIGWKKNADELKAFWQSEPQRHAVGQRFLDRVWRRQ